METGFWHQPFSEDRLQYLMQNLVFTDMDGTLLDHHTYSYDPAKPMLAHLRQANIPLILATSKTRSEVLIWQEKLGIDSPFIVENGAGVFVREEGEVRPIGNYLDYGAIRGLFAPWREQYGVRGFGDMDVGEVVELTGLEGSSAKLAMRRDFSEPFICQRELSVAFLEEASDAGLKVLKGGRFYHLLDERADKGSALMLLKNHYADRYGSIQTFALGDSPNDFSMLEVADKAILIPHPDGTHEPCVISGLIRASAPGPEGWNAALKKLLG